MLGLVILLDQMGSLKSWDKAYSHPVKERSGVLTSTAFALGSKVVLRLSRCRATCQDTLLRLAVPVL